MNSFPFLLVALTAAARGRLGATYEGNLSEDTTLWAACLGKLCAHTSGKPCSNIDQNWFCTTTYVHEP